MLELSLPRTEDITLAVQWDRDQRPVELSTILREVKQCSKKPLLGRAFSLLKAPTSTLTIKNPLRHYA